MAPINNAQSGSEILQQVVHILTQHGLIHPYSEQDTQALSVGVTLPKSEALTGNRGFHAALTILTLDTGDAHFPLEFSSWLVVLDASIRHLRVPIWGRNVVDQVQSRGSRVQSVFAGLRVR